MTKAIGLAFIGGLMIGVFLGLMLMSFLLAGKDDEFYIDKEFNNKSKRN